MNRIQGRVIIIDSAMGNVLALTSANIPIHLDTFNVNAIAFWSADTTAALLLTGANTANDIYFKHDYPAGSGNAYANPQWFSFGMAQPMQILKAPIVTNGTAFIYFV